MPFFTLTKLTSFKRVLSLGLALAIFLSPLFILAEDQDALKERQALEAELRQLEEQISQYEADISKTEAEKKTLQNQIYLLRQQIEKLNLQIYQSNIMIKDLGYQITDTESSIERTSLKIKESRKHLAAILQQVFQEDQKSLLEIFISEASLSGFFDNLMALEALNLKSRELLEDIKNLKVYLGEQKTALDQEKEGLEQVVTMQTLQRQESESVKKDKDYYLRLTEAEYQAQLAQKAEVEKRAAEIRARIFELIGVPEAPTFGEAYEIAKYVESITGVRPAFLLAVLTQESNIGKNVGQCFLRDPKTGSGVLAYNGKAIERVMKPMGLSGRKGDVDDFLKITAELGRDPYNTPVSCPMSYGWGGAMGPAQFIPTTWMLYRNRAAAITGKAPDPWNIKDAFIAAALYLADYGAARRDYNNEWRAAMIYFSGTTNLKYRFYGDSVMRIAASLQKDIETIEGSN